MENFVIKKYQIIYEKSQLPGALFESHHV